MKTNYIFFMALMTAACIIASDKKMQPLPKTRKAFCESLGRPVSHADLNKIRYATVLGLPVHNKK